MLIDIKGQEPRGLIPMVQEHKLIMKKKVRKVLGHANIQEMGPEPHRDQESLLVIFSSQEEEANQEAVEDRLIEATLWLERTYTAEPLMQCGP